MGEHAPRPPRRCAIAGTLFAPPPPPPPHTHTFFHKCCLPPLPIFLNEILHHFVSDAHRLVLCARCTQVSLACHTYRLVLCCQPFMESFSPWKLNSILYILMSCAVLYLPPVCTALGRGNFPLPVPTISCFFPTSSATSCFLLSIPCFILLLPVGGEGQYCGCVGAGLCWTCCDNGSSGCRGLQGSSC